MSISRILHGQPLDDLAAAKIEYDRCSSLGRSQPVGGREGVVGEVVAGVVENVSHVELLVNSAERPVTAVHRDCAWERRFRAGRCCWSGVGGKANHSGTLAAVAVVAAGMTTVLQSRLVASAPDVVHAEARRVNRTKAVHSCVIPGTRVAQLTAGNIRILDSPFIVADRSSSDEHISFMASCASFQANVVAVSSTV